MAKVYWETPFHRVSKTLFGPWQITDIAKNYKFDVTIQVADRFGEVVKLARTAGYDTKRDPIAVGAVFTWLISVSCGDFLDQEVLDTMSEIMFASDQNTLTLLNSIYKKLENAGLSA